MRWLIFILMIISNGDIWAKERSPFNIEVKADAIVLLPDPMYYSILFSDEEEREIAVGNISESKDFRKLLEFVTNNVGKTGPLRGKRVTVINFLIRPEGVDTYREVKQVVDKFEIENMGRLALGLLPNGDIMVQPLSSKMPYLDADFDGNYSEPKEIPRDPKTGTALLQPKVVLISNGKVISFINTGKDTGKELEAFLKGKVSKIIDSNNINVGDGRYITDEKQAIKLIDEFNKEQITNKHFEVELFRNGSHIYFKLLPTDECGEDPEKAVQSLSARSLTNLEKYYYLKYLVEPNSFEAYQAIRKYTDGRGFWASWTIVDPDSYTHTLPSGYSVGEKPRPFQPQPSAPKRLPKPVKSAFD